MDFLSKAKELAQQASEKIIEIGQRSFQKSKKEDNSWVTEADLASDQIIREGLLKAFPQHAILTEETGLIGREGSDWLWMIDPLDGTKAYAKGIPGYSVMVGLLKEGIPCLGIVVDPVLGLTYEAVRGQGSFLTEKKIKKEIRVSQRNDFSQMPLVVSTGFPEDKLKQLQITLKGPLCLPINSVGIKVGHLVRQEADIYLNHHSVHYWDTCAPQMILEEAGGCFSRIDGKPLSYEMNKNYSHESLTLATNNTRHEEIRYPFLTSFDSVLALPKK